MKFYTFRTIIEPDENGTYHGWVPALKGCHTWGDSLKQVKENLKDAIRVYLASLMEDGEEIPTDQGLELIETIPEEEIKYQRYQPAYA